MIQQIIFECNYCTSNDYCKHKKKAGGALGDSCLYTGQLGGLWVCMSTEAQNEFLEKNGSKYHG